MIKVKLYSGRIIEGNSHKEILEGVKNNNMFTMEQSLEEYMQGLKRRYLTLENAIININDYEYAVNLLNEYGVLEILEDVHV